MYRYKYNTFTFKQETCQKHKNTESILRPGEGLSSKYRYL